MNGFLAPALSNRNSEAFRIALSDNLFKGEERNDYICAIKSWTYMVAEENDFKADGRVDIFDARKAQGTKLHAFDSLVLTPLDIIYMPVKPKSVYLAVQDNGFHANYLIVVNKKGPLCQVQDLKGINIELFNSGWESLARPWIISLLYEKAQMPVQKIDEKLFFINNPSKGVLKVFFGQSDAVVVRKKAFEIACELNPQLKSELTVLAESPPFIPLFVTVNNTRQRAVVEKMAEAILNLHKKERGRQILSFYRGVRMEKHPFSVLNSTISFLNNYWNIVDGRGGD